MDSIRRANISRCRLCGSNSNQAISIFDETRHKPNALSEQIFRCVDVRVYRNDKITKSICQNCFEKIQDFVLFRAICASTMVQLRLSLANGIDEATVDVDEMDELRADQEIVTEAEKSSSKINAFGVRPVSYTSLMGDELDMENEDTKVNIVGRLNAMSETGATITPAEKKTQTEFNLFESNSPNARSAIQSEGAFNDNETIVKSECDTPDQDFDATQPHPERINDVRCSTTISPVAYIPVSFIKDEIETKTEEIDVNVAAKLSLQRPMNAEHTDTSRERTHCHFPMCSASFSNKFGLRAHINGQHTKKISFECTKCSDQFYYRSRLEYHLARKHGEGVSFSCYLCKKTLSTKQNLQIHMNVKHPRTSRERVHCHFPMCLASFKSKQDLNCHINFVHTKRIAFECSKCSDKFYYRNQLKIHLAIKHGDENTFGCDLCKKTLSSKWSLQYHMNSKHTRTSRVRVHCPIPMCSASYSNKYNLEVHINAQHTKKIAFKCTKCSGKFYHRNLLEYHLMNEHDEANTFSCYLCKKTISTKQSLHRHMNVKHTTKRKLLHCPLPMCSASFNLKQHLNCHINHLHIKSIAFKCTKCSDKFYYHNQLEYHLVNEHDDRNICGQ